MDAPVVTTQAAEAKPQPWDSSLLGCFSDCSSCCLGFWCPCVLFGKNYEQLGAGSSCGGCCMFFLLMFCRFDCFMETAQRQRIHKNYNREGSCCGACCTAFWCQTCSLCQDAREIKSIQKKDQFATSTGTVVAAPVEQQMTSEAPTVEAVAPVVDQAAAVTAEKVVTV